MYVPPRVGRSVVLHVIRQVGQSIIKIAVLESALEKRCS